MKKTPKKEISSADVPGHAWNPFVGRCECGWSTNSPCWSARQRHLRSALESIQATAKGPEPAGGFQEPRRPSRKEGAGFDLARVLAGLIVDGVVGEHSFGGPSEAEGVADYLEILLERDTKELDAIEKLREWARDERDES